MRRAANGQGQTAERVLIHGKPRITEGYHCNYGLNREYEALLFSGSLRPTAHDLSGEVRGVELSGHPFFVAVLFQRRCPRIS